MQLKLWEEREQLGNVCRTFTFLSFQTIAMREETSIYVGPPVGTPGRIFF